MAVARGAGALIAALQRRVRHWQARRTPPVAMLELDRRHIFIMPNRVGAAFLLTLLLMLLAAINYQNSLAYALVFLLGSVFVVAILHTFRNLAGLRVSGVAAGSVFVGEQARFVLRLESLQRAHQAVGAGWTAARMQRVDIDAGHVLELELDLPSERRGWLVAPRLCIDSTFPLGLLRAWTWVDPGQRVLVYPQPLEGELPSVAARQNENDEEGLRAFGQGVDDYQGLKEYQPGDSWRRLHWKAWSRGGALLVKDFAEIKGRDLNLDFLALGGDVEQRLSRLCYWVLRLTREQQAFSLQLPGQAIATASGDHHCERCLRALALYGGGP
jgi:uncharacterized protein (DUF58 family)